MDAFAAMTQRVIEEDGFDEYQPTACYPERRVLRVLEGVPASADLESVVIDWALGEREGEEELLLAFKLGDASFKVIRYVSGETEECLYPADPSAPPASARTLN